MVGSDYDDKVIYTDNEMTKYHIWTAYEGFKTFFMDWSMSQMNERKKKYLEMGVRKYAEEFLIQISTFITQDKLGKNVDVKDLLKAKEMVGDIKNGRFNPTEQDLKFLRLFAESFLVSSGMKDIVRLSGSPGRAISGG